MNIVSITIRSEYSRIFPNILSTIIESENQNVDSEEGIDTRYFAIYTLQYSFSCRQYKYSLRCNYDVINECKIGEVL